MASIYTIDGAPRRRKKRSSRAQKSSQKRFARAAKRCKGRGYSPKQFRACMRREMK